MNKFIGKLKGKNIIVGDGGMGTGLQSQGLSSGEAPENWNLKYPQKVKKVHKDYLKAGADLIETNTFGGNYFRLKESNLENKLEKINETAVRIAQNAANRETIIAGSVGPTGKMLKPLGTLSKNEVLEAYQKQISILLNNGVDVIILETFSDINEIEQALKAVNDFEIPVIAQMNFRENMTTVMGCDIKTMIAVFKKYEINVLGFNCTPGAKKTLPLIKKLREHNEKPFSVFPNAGEPLLQEGKVTYPEGSEDFIPFIKKFIDLNVRIIGGCCGTNPEIIKKIKKEVNDWQ